MNSRSVGRVYHERRLGRVPRALRISFSCLYQILAKFAICAAVKLSRKLTDEVLDLAEKTNKAALNRYRECDNSVIWPTGFEEIRIIDTL